MAAAVSTCYTRADAVLLGRVTYEAFASSWPFQPEEEVLAQSTTFATGVVDLIYQCRLSGPEPSDQNNRS